MKLDAVKKVYKRYAPYYDAVFGKVLDHGRQEMLKQMTFENGDRILEVGVGTGISLTSYPTNTTVVGIDISPEMLEKAQERITNLQLTHVSVEVMDAQLMSFPDNSFDQLAIMYVVSVVPNPKKLMDEAKRVCKPNGFIYIVNHFGAQNKVMQFIEHLLDKIADKLGWQAAFSLPKFIEENHLKVVSKKGVNLFKYWTLLKVENVKALETKTRRTDTSHKTVH